MLSLPKARRKRIAKHQDYKCNNRPGVSICDLENFECPQWRTNKGSITAGYRVCRILENGSNDDVNLQALCHECYTHKTSDKPIEKKLDKYHININGNVNLIISDANLSELFKEIVVGALHIRRTDHSCVETSDEDDSDESE